MKKSKILSFITVCVCTVTVLVGTNVTVKSVTQEKNNIRTQYDLVKLNKNLIKNSSFENGSQYWKTKGEAQVSNYENAAATGDKFGLLPINTKDSVIYQIINVKPNTKYVARAKVLVAKKGGKAFFNVKTPDLSSLINNAEVTVNYDESYDWKYQDIKLEFNSGNNKEIALSVMKWTESNMGPIYEGQVYVDDIYLEENNSEAENNDYKIIWADDFNNKELDESKWEYELGSIRGIEQQRYVNDKENVFIRDNESGGELVLQATDRPKDLQYINPRSKGTNDERKVIYNSGSIRTHGKQEFLYGRIEMKAKLPKGQGVFPAFWTLGSDFTLDGDISKSQGYGWARCGEIDIMELIGSRENGSGNKTVYQTIHTADTSDDNTYQKLGGTSYKINDDFYDNYHIFGVDWSKGKIQWYVDDVIVATVDYKNNPVASKALDRPHYIQMNLAMGGAWPGKVATDLGGKLESQYAIDYVYYAQNNQQKEDAEEYYKSSPKIEEAKDIVIYEGDTDLLSNVKVSNNASVDFSITDYPQFGDKEKNDISKDPITSVDLVCTGKNDLTSLANLPAGRYSLYYTALPKSLKLDDKGIPDGKQNYKFDRKGYNLIIKKRSLDLEKDK